jgi:3-deoxy-D-manno-octulosonic-acid transferase
MRPERVMFGAAVAAITMAAVYVIYSLLLALALMLAVPWWIVQAIRHGKYRAGLRERLGNIPARLRLQPGERRIWVHAVSVGEVLAVSNLVARLRDAFPKHRVLVSTTTLTGQTLARQLFGEENVFYFPLDVGRCVRRWMSAVSPELVVLAETEFWPNFLQIANTNRARVAVVNARISDRSLPRYRRFRRLLAPVLRNVNAFAAQSREDARRLVEIGADASRVQVAGNLKFEVSPPVEPEFVRWLRANIRQEQAAPVIVAGSTVEGEEPYVLEAFANVLRERSHAVLVLAPRHKERFEAVAGLLKQSGVPFLRRSEWRANQASSVAGKIVLLDSIGELASVYAVADVAFVGGSLVQRGGHNILEAAQFGAPVITGPYTQNFRDIMQAFTSENAVVIAQADRFSAVLLELIHNQAKRREIGARGASVVKTNAGATERTLAILEALLRERVPA